MAATAAGISVAMVAFLLSLAVALPVQAVDRVNVDKRDRVAGNPLALRGYDPVAYFTVGEPQKGSQDFLVVLDGATYLFASAEHKEAFEAEPEKYLPAYGGFCAYAVARGKKYDSDPKAFKIVDGRLFLNFSRKVQKKWEKDVPGFIAEAEKQWAEIEDLPEADLK
jgi:YHS domain-containing protein